MTAECLPGVLQLLSTSWHSTRHARHDMLQDICGHAESLSCAGVQTGMNAASDGSIMLQ